MEPIKASAVHIPLNSTTKLRTQKYFYPDDGTEGMIIEIIKGCTTIRSEYNAPIPSIISTKDFLIIYSLEKDFLEIKLVVGIRSDNFEILNLSRLEKLELFKKCYEEQNTSKDDLDIEVVTMGSIKKKRKVYYINY